MKPKAISSTMQSRADDQFDFGVFTLYSRHHFTASGLVDDVSHNIIPIALRFLASDIMLWQYL